MDLDVAGSNPVAHPKILQRLYVKLAVETELKSGSRLAAFHNSSRSRAHVSYRDLDTTLPRDVIHSKLTTGRLHVLLDHPWSATDRLEFGQGDATPNSKPRLVLNYHLTVPMPPMK